MNSLQELLSGFLFFLRPIPALLISIALLIFMWKMMRQMNAGGSIDGKKLRSAILMGVFILFAMTAVWGLVNVIISIVFPSGVLLSPGI